MVKEQEKNYTFGSYKSQIQKILDEFNSSVSGVFRVESRVLIPSSDPRVWDQKGIIIEYLGKMEDFEKYFEKYSDEIESMAYKLDKRSSIYQYPFRSEFCDINKWVDYNNTKVAYNYSL